MHYIELPTATKKKKCICYDFSKLLRCYEKSSEFYNFFERFAVFFLKHTSEFIHKLHPFFYMIFRKYFLISDILQEWQNPLSTKFQFLNLNKFVWHNTENIATDDKCYSQKSDQGNHRAISRSRCKILPVIFAIFLLCFPLIFIYFYFYYCSIE